MNIEYAFKEFGCEGKREGLEMRAGQIRIKILNLCPFLFWLKKRQDLNIVFCDCCFQNAISKLNLNKPKYSESKKVHILLMYFTFKQKLQL